MHYFKTHENEEMYHHLRKEHFKKYTVPGSVLYIYYTDSPVIWMQYFFDKMGENAYHTCTFMRRIE